MLFKLVYRKKWSECYSISGVMPLMLVGGWYTLNTQQIGRWLLVVRTLGAAARPATIAIRSKIRCKEPTLGEPICSVLSLNQFSIKAAVL